MKNKHSRTLRRIIASALVLLMVTAPVSPVADVFNFSKPITVNAVTYEDVDEIGWDALAKDDVLVGPITINATELSTSNNSYLITPDTVYYQPIPGQGPTGSAGGMTTEINLEEEEIEEITISAEGNFGGEAQGKVNDVATNAWRVMDVRTYGTGASATKEITFRATLDIASENIEIAAVDDQLWTGSELTPALTIKNGTYTLVEGTDYSVEYTDNVAPGTATATVTGLGCYYGETEVTFDIAAPFTAPEDANTVIYKNKTTLAPQLNGQDVVKAGYYIISDYQLTFDTDAIDVKEYKPNVSNHPFRSTANLKTKYCYFVISVSSEVIATHEHVYIVQTAQSKLNVRCDGEPGNFVTAAEITIPANNYEYGDKVDIETKSYAIEAYDIAEDDISFSPIVFRTDDGLTEEVPTELGNYYAEALPYFSKTDLTYGLSKDFTIGKKNIANLIKKTNGQELVPSETKDDHIKVALIPANDAADLTETEGLVEYTITYDGVAYVPQVTLVNYVYNYSNHLYDPEVVDDGDYTVTFTPKNDTTTLDNAENAGTYTVTVTAVEREDNNYTGSGSFEWKIAARNFEGLSITDNRDSTEYSNTAVTEDDFTVAGLGTDANPGTTTGNSFSYKWYEYDEETEEFAEMAENETPIEAGTYKVEVTVSNDNYNNETVDLEFVIAQREVVITPSEDNNIVYGDFFPETLAWTAENTIDGIDIDEDNVSLLVIVDYDGEDPVYAEPGDILNAGEYTYELSTDVIENRNYTFVLNPEAPFVVDRKVLTKEMFTVDPTSEFVYNKTEQQVTVTGDDTIPDTTIETDPNEVVPMVQLMSDSDWEVLNDTDKATNAGTYTVLIVPTENGNYKLADGTESLALDGYAAEIPDGPSAFVDQSWTISPKSIADETVTVTVTNDNTEFTGSDITAEVVVKDTEGTETTLASGTDYELVDAEDVETGNYADAQSLTQVNAGTYTFYVVGKGNYNNERAEEWTIDKKELADGTLKISGLKSFTYDGNDASSHYTAKGMPADANYAAITYSYEAKQDNEWVAVNGVPSNAGEYRVKAEASSSDNYKDASTNWFEFKILKREVELYPVEGQSAQFGEQPVIEYTYEKAQPETITGVVDKDDKDAPFNFEGALTLSDPDEAGFCAIVINPDAVFVNYQPTCDESVDFEITKKELEREWFTLVYDTDNANEVDPDGTEFAESAIKVKVVATAAAPEGIMDAVNVSGTTVAYLPEENAYKVYVKAKKASNYKDPAAGPLAYTWKINAKELDARVVVDDNTETSGGMYPGYYFNGMTPDVDIVANDGVLPEYTQKSYTYYVLTGTDPETGDDIWEPLPAAPVDAGSYKVEGTADKKGYDITVEEDYFEIQQRYIPLRINLNDLHGYYNPAGEYVVDFTELDAETALSDELLLARLEGYDVPAGYIASDKNAGAHVVGTIKPALPEGDEGTVGNAYDLDLSGLTVQFGEDEENISANYTFILMYKDGNRYVELTNDDAQYTISAAPIRDSWIVFDNDGVFDKYDIGATTASFGVYYNGDENYPLVEGTDYIVAGETEAEDTGDAHIVQVMGMGKYADYAEKAWTMAYNETAKAAAAEAIDAAIDVTLTDPTAKLTNGQKKITTKAAGVFADGADQNAFTITRTGVIYYTGDDDAVELTRENVAGNDQMFELGRNTAAAYTANIPTDGTARVVGFVVANNGQYETVVYSEEKTWTYDDLVEYTVTVVGGTIDENGETQVTHTGTEIKTNKPVVNVTADEADEGQQFYFWEKNGVIVSYNQSLSIYAAEKNLTLTAVYVPADMEIEKLAVTNLESITPIVKSGVNKLSFVTMSSVPDDCTILQAGLIFALEEADADTLISANYPDNTRGKASTAHNYRYTWNKTYTEGETYYVRAYVQYQKEGNEDVLEAYGKDVYKADWNGYEIV